VLTVTGGGPEHAVTTSAAHTRISRAAMIVSDLVGPKL